MNKLRNEWSDIISLGSYYIGARNPGETKVTAAPTGPQTAKHRKLPMDSFFIWTLSVSAAVQHYGSDSKE